ncbi:PEP-CTERM sorting domain-containing protein [Verrucomicrobiota bacterium sgz303538]
MMGIPPYTTRTLALAGDWITDRTVEIGAQATRIDTAGFNATLNGVFTQNPSSSAQPKLEKVGAGTLLLRNAASYYGDLAITGGAVTIDGSIGSYGSLDVGINGRLAGIGSVPRSITVQGTLDPGLTAPGLLTTGNLTFSDGAKLALQLASATQYDRLGANGSVLLNGSTGLLLELRFDPVDFVDSFMLLANDGTDAIGGTGRFTLNGNTLEEGETFYSGTQAFRISYTGGTGNDVVLSAVPEPASAGLLAIGCGMLSLTRLRCRSRARGRM